MHNPKKKKISRPFPLWASEDYRTKDGRKPKMPSWRKPIGNTGKKGSFGHAPTPTNRQKSIKARISHD
jgi:hypothetical protein